MTARNVIAKVFADGSDPRKFARGVLVGRADEVLDALAKAGYAVVKLPKPGRLSDHHMDDQKVWYHGQYGEFVGETVRMSPPEPFPISDEDGNAWSINGLRDMGLAALAAAGDAEIVQRLPESSS